jgi:hypothetical protein
MFRENVSFIIELFQKEAPIDQIIAAFAETFLAVEEHLELHGDPGLDETQTAQFASAVLAIVDGVDQLNEVLALRLEGNVAFLRRALLAGQPPDEVVYFMARTLDAVRAPIANMSLTGQQRERLSRATANMMRGLHELEPLL